jgi:hypothetical protein
MVQWLLQFGSMRVDLAHKRLPCNTALLRCQRRRQLRLLATLLPRL